MKYIHETSPKEEIDEFFKQIPPNLYKYRQWNDDYHKMLLTNNELYFSSPAKFNDPYDCGLPFKQHPENSDAAIIKLQMEETAPRRFPNLANDKIALEEHCAKQVLLIQQNPTSWFEMNWGYTPEELHKRFGVLSLTPYYNKYLMWSHYADSHKGFCVEFNTRLVVESVAGHFQKVEYSENIPYFSIRDSLEDELMTKLIYTKSKLWDYEDEYRLTRIHHSNTVMNFKPESLIGIYLGCKMPVEYQMEIIAIAQKRFPWAKIYQMQLSKENFELSTGEIKLF